ncbi:MAG: glutathione binding-like protein [Bauldia sp.]|nr:glutathione binding-like protein [Bauldia sp.]
MPATQILPIELYYWDTPNGFKISIALEEMAVPYITRFVNIGKGDQFKPEFLAISPNNRIPAIVDPEGPDGKPISVFESGAILIYLGDKFGRLYGADARERVAVNEWLIWQVANVGPVFGHNNHFRRYAKEQAPYALKRFGDETHRLYRVLNERLEGRDYVAGDYSIADIAIFSWARNWTNRGVDIAEFRNVEAWHDRIAARPAVQRGLALKAPVALDIVNDEEARKVLFGQR